MHYRAVVFAVFSASCLLSACSGGGGSSPLSPTSGTPPQGSQGGVGSGATDAPSASPTDTPAPTASPATYPLADGNTFVYAGTLRQAYQSFPEVVPPGSPRPEPIATTVTAVTQTVTVKSGQSFAGRSGLFGLHSAESDALSSGLETTTSTTDTYEAPVTLGAGTQLLAYGSQYTDEAGDGVSTVPNPATILDELPHSAGATWSNGPASTIDEAIAGNATGSAITVVRTTNADGSYTEKTTYPPDYSGIGVTGVGTAQENTDGSGTFAIEANGSIITLTYSPPEPQPSGPPLIIVNEYASTDTTGQPAQSFAVQSWYGAVPALYAETDRDDGVVAVPAACGLAPSLPQQATELEQTTAHTDTLLGFTETQTAASYVAPGYGLLCATFADKQTLYYDFNGDEAAVFTETPPLEIVTASQTLALQPQSTIADARTRAASLARARVFAGALRARFDHALAFSRHRRIAELVRHMLPHGTHGAGR